MACQVFRSFVLLKKKLKKNCVTIELTLGVNGVLLNIYMIFGNTIWSFVGI